MTIDAAMDRNICPRTLMWTATTTSTGNGLPAQHRATVADVETTPAPSWGLEQVRAWQSGGNDSSHRVAYKSG